MFIAQPVGSRAIRFGNSIIVADETPSQPAASKVSRVIFAKRLMIWQIIDALLFRDPLNSVEPVDDDHEVRMWGALAT